MMKVWIICAAVSFASGITLPAMAEEQQSVTGEWPANAMMGLPPPLLTGDWHRFGGTVAGRSPVIYWLRTRQQR